MTRRTAIRHLAPVALLVGLATPLLAGAGSLVFVESVPLETDLGSPQVPDAPDVWLELVRGAEHQLDIFSFYVSPDPDGEGPLRRILDAAVARAEQGVAVRLLTDAKFHATYPETHDRFVAHPDLAARLFDGQAAWGGGVLHAKGMIIDGRRFFLGSQNWDWRALEHIHELGVVVDHPGLAAELSRIFAVDWAFAGDEATPELAPDATHRPVVAPTHTLALPDGSRCRAMLAASPPHALPEGVAWDLPLLLDQIDTATERVRLQLLSYNPGDRDGGYWPDLDVALRRAAARGCEVQISLANWAKRSYMLPHLKSLSVLPGIEVRFTNIPEWSGGFIPFARVAHAKYVTCDGRALWLGTSNGSRDYFHHSRNVSLFLRGAGCTAFADAFFARSWTSAHAETIDPAAEYTPPRRQ